ncbi:hypothetical protein ABZV31_37135 [Streptomyces sp. NPDC005202]|uniref:hypothetical protein n=1 Tax=Streptomyces sp. NPDC005202 TaxID=3157021 RepID=UPI0033A73C6B
MSESNDMLTVLLMCAGLLHILTMLGMTLHTALAPDSPDDECGQNRTLKALFLGRAPVQRTGRNMLNSRLLTCSGLLPAAASAMSLAKAAAPAWIAVLAVLALAQLASAYAWYKPDSVNTAGAAERGRPEDTATERDDEADGEEASQGPGSS